MMMLAVGRFWYFLFLQLWNKQSGFNQADVGPGLADMVPMLAGRVLEFADFGPSLYEQSHLGPTLAPEFANI